MPIKHLWRYAGQNVVLNWQIRGTPDYAPPKLFSSKIFSLFVQKNAD
jgi:hypothetical protein